MSKYLKFAAIFFLFLLLFRAGGFLTLFQVHQKLIKREIKKQIIAGLPDNELKVFKFSLDENYSLKGIKWVEEDEFIFKGKMFDVVRVKIIDGEKLLYCYEDNKETNLTNRMNKLQKDFQNNPIEKNSTNLLVQLLNTPFEIQAHQIVAGFASIKNHSFHYFFRLKSWSAIPVYPPPKF